MADSQTANTATCGLAPTPGQDWAVTIINQTGLDFVDVFFVADHCYTFGNTDGSVAGALAMKIDWLGINKPLIFENKNFDGIFEAGETWGFLVNSFQPGLRADALRLAGRSLGGHQLERQHRGQRGPRAGDRHATGPGPLARSPSQDAPLISAAAARTKGGALNRLRDPRT